MTLKNRIKYFINNFDWMRVYFSPFKPPIPKLYIGKVAIGTPYFLPRKWVKGNHQSIHKAIIRHIESQEHYNKLNPNYAREIKSYDELYQEKKNYSFAVPKRIGFDFVSLGWKIKWTDTDYRFEWSPIWSFVFFKWQIAITFVAPEIHHYWECWLYYTRETKGTTKQRLEQARKEFPCVWTRHSGDKKETTCYWNIILKDKYR